LSLVLALPLSVGLTACGPKPPETPVAAPRKVSALGRIEPESKIRKVSVASSLAGDRVEKLLVAEGDVVKEGQPLAILNSYQSLKAAREEAKEQVSVASAELDQVKAGAKQGEIQAQEAKVLSLERQLLGEQRSQDEAVASARATAKEASLERDRYDKLHASGAVSELQRDRYRTRAETSAAELRKVIETRDGTLSTTRADIASARSTLEQIKEVRPQDLATATSKLRKAEATRTRAEQEFANATVRAPQAGQVLRIIARPGDKVGDGGLLEMADTSRMVVTAEVYQTDLPKLSVGQKATITVDGIPGSLTGQITQVLPQVRQQSVYSGQPGENLDQRVFEVKLKLDTTPELQKKLSFASNLQVNVVFN
jgi:HlyD family secretion protein